MKKDKLLRSKRKGFAVPMALITVVLLLTMGMTIISMGLNARVYAIRTTSDISAQCAADAGLTKALFEMKQKIQGVSWFGEMLPCEENTILQNCDAAFSYTVSTNSSGGYIIESTGTSGINQRTVSCTLEQRNPFDCAIFSNGFITLHNSSIIDWYNFESEEEAAKFDVGTNSTNDGAVELKDSAVIKGNVVVGQAGDPDDVISISNGAEIEGTTDSLPEERELLAPIIPASLQSAVSGGTIENNTTISGSGKYDSIDLKSGKTITINSSGVELYVTGDMILGNSAELVIEEGASLTIYLEGDLIGKNSCEINNETEIPKNLQIYGLEGCTALDMRNSSDLYGVIYTPYADITIHNSVTIYGSAICNTFDMRSTGEFQYDASLKDADLPAAPTEFVVANWSEDKVQKIKD